MGSPRLPKSEDICIPLLSNDGIHFLCDDQSSVDDRLILTFRKQKHNASCGVASLCVVMAALNIGNRESCSSDLSDIDKNHEVRAQTETVKVEKCDSKKSKGCSEILQNLQKSLLQFIAKTGNEKAVSFLDSFESSKAILKREKGNVTNKTVVWLQRHVLDQMKLEDDNKEKRSESKSKNDKVKYASSLWCDEEDILNSVEMKSVFKVKNLLSHGMTLDQVFTLLNAFKLKGQLIYTSETTLDDLRKNIVNVIHNSNDCVIVNFNTKFIVPNKPAHGHHSPLGGYNSNYDLFLLLDVHPESTEKWVSAAKLFQGMNTIDHASDKSRGYLIVSNAGK